MTKHNAIALGFAEIAANLTAEFLRESLLLEASDLDAKADALEAFAREFQAACARLENAHMGMGTYALSRMAEGFSPVLEARVRREWAKEVRQEAGQL